MSGRLHDLQSFIIPFVHRRPSHTSSEGSRVLVHSLWSPYPPVRPPVLGARPLPFAGLLSIVALGAATGLAQHRAEFVHQIRRHQDLPALERSPAEGPAATLSGEGQSRGLGESGRGRGLLRPAGVHRASSLRHLRGLEQAGRGVCLAGHDGVPGRRRPAVGGRDSLVCRLQGGEGTDLK